MTKNITVAELARQLEIMIEQGYGDHEVVYLTPDSMTEWIEHGVWDVWHQDKTVVLG